MVLREPLTALFAQNQLSFYSVVDGLGSLFFFAHSGYCYSMIEVTKLDGSVFYVNPHQIEYIECRPDTSLIMLSGKRLVIKDTYPVILERIIAYRKQIGAFKNEE